MLTKIHSHRAHREIDYLFWRRPSALHLRISTPGPSPLLSTHRSSPFFSAVAGKVAELYSDLPHLVIRLARAPMCVRRANTSTHRPPSLWQSRPYLQVIPVVDTENEEFAVQILLGDLSLVIVPGPAAGAERGTGQISARKELLAFERHCSPCATRSCTIWD